MTVMLTDTQQHMVALAEANRIRLIIAEWRREMGKLPINDGRERIAKLLEQGDLGNIGAVRLGAALTTIHRVGPTQARRIINRALPHSRNLEMTRLRDLTSRQREELAFRLRWP